MTVKDPLKALTSNVVRTYRNGEFSAQRRVIAALFFNAGEWGVTLAENPGNQGIRDIFEANRDTAVDCYDALRENLHGALKRAHGSR